ncbi:MAG: hypothetical protein Q8R02_23350 [Hyphomonadaceae bacterium]|nr:hypothetical protein [Hyphomonadaceae bacterium]
MEIARRIVENAVAHYSRGEVFVMARALLSREMLRSDDVPRKGSGETEARPAAALRDVIAERARQISAEGWTEAHDDDQHPDGHLAKAAAMYAIEALPAVPVARLFKDLWPWDLKWWKPKGHRRNLVRAGALIIAEIERLDRAEPKAEGQAEAHPAAAPAAEHPSSPSRDSVLEEALRKLIRQIDAHTDGAMVHYNIDLAVAHESARRALKDVRPDAAGEKQGDRSAT